MHYLVHLREKCDSNYDLDNFNFFSDCIYIWMNQFYVLFYVSFEGRLRMSMQALLLEHQLKRVHSLVSQSATKWESCRAVGSAVHIHIV